MKDLVECLRAGELAGARYVLASQGIVPMGRNGAHLGSFAGSSLEFREYREYQPGDDLRRLDWGAYARSDKMIVKLFQQEVQPHLDLVIDGSRSMGHTVIAKAQATVGVAASLATAAGQASYSHAAWITRTACERVANGTGRPSSWQGLSLDAVGNPDLAMRRQPPAWRPRSVRILVSDLLWLGDPNAVLSQLTDRAAASMIVQVLSRQDVAPEASGFVQLLDSESGETRTLRLDRESVRSYLDAFRRHNDAWYEAARRAGVTLVRLIAEEVTASWQFDALVAAHILQVK